MRVIDANSGKELPESISNWVENSLVNSIPYPHDIICGDN